MHDPADPERVVGHAAAADEDQGRRAVSAAQEAFPAWAALGAHERAAQVKASLGALGGRQRRSRRAALARERQGPLGVRDRDARAREPLRARRRAWPAWWRGARAAGPPFRTHDRRLPLGVVSLIVPFNWPLAILAASLPRRCGRQHRRRQGAADDAAGVRAHARADRRRLPPGVLNVVCGHDAVLGPVLIQDPRVRKVGFTGSVARREADHGDGRRQPHAGAARARRQRPRDRARRRRARRGAIAQPVHRRLPDHRPGLHGDEAAVRAPLPLRRGRRGPERRELGAHRLGPGCTPTPRWGR